jgi:hypothetical protein
MKTFLLLFLATMAFRGAAAVAQDMRDPAHIEIQVTPFYDAAGPKIQAGTFSAGLASASEPEFVATIRKMKQSWDKLGFPEMYVAAIRLYDLGYRNEAVYWFYSAQYRGKLFGTVLDQANMGSLGEPGFELFHAAGAFQQLAGMWINGYAFGNVDQLLQTIQRVQKEGLVLPDLKAAYRGVTFKDEVEWKAANSGVNDGLNEFLAVLKAQRSNIHQQRVDRGIEAKFSGLTSKEL